MATNSEGRDQPSSQELDASGPASASSSPETSSTRLNPFSDSESARKRRRMHSSDSQSLSDASDSETGSRSVQKTPQTSSTPNSTPRQSPILLSTGDISIPSSSHSSVPHTGDPHLPKMPGPETSPPAQISPTSVRRNSHGGPSDTPISAPSSCVTINIRPTTTQPSPSLPPIGPTELDQPPTGTKAATLVEPEPEPDSPPIHNSVEVDGDVKMASTSNDLDGLNFGAEVDADSDDDVICTGVSTIDPNRAGILRDPTNEFPYNENQNFADNIGRLCEFLSSGSDEVDESLFESLAGWIDTWLAWAKTSDMALVVQSMTINQALWRSLPDLVWSFAQRKLTDNMVQFGPPYQALAAFIDAYSRLCAHMVLLDTNCLIILASDGDQTILPGLYNNQYLVPLHVALQKMDEIASMSGYQQSNDAMTIVCHLVLTESTSPSSLTDLLVTIEGLAPRFPKLLDGLSGIVSIACRMSEMAAMQASQELLDVIDLPSCLKGCHEFHTVATRLAERATETSIPHLTSDGVLMPVSRLDGILKACLTGSHPLALATKEEFMAEFPTVPSQVMAECISSRWKFRIFSKLIKSSQMQLRVGAAASFCHSLVTIWRRYGDQPDEASPVLLEFMAHQVCECGVLDYILSPTCHPEVSTECYNIVGFLAITRFYSQEHLDQAWGTLSTCQNPRVTEALLRMIGRVLDLFDYPVVVTHCEKLIHLPLESFANPSFKAFTEAVIKAIITRRPSNSPLSLLPFNLCLRLLRESTSACAPLDHKNLMEVHQLAMGKLKELFLNTSDASGRSVFYSECLEDIHSKSPTSIGSLCGLHIALKLSVISVELHELTVNHDFGKLLVDEFEHAMDIDQNALLGPYNLARQELIHLMISHEPAVFDGKLGSRLWDLLVGSRVVSTDARRAGWFVINTATRNDVAFRNPFLKSCFDSYLPILPPHCLCEGALEFVRLRLLPRLSEEDGLNDLQLDDEDSVLSSGIETLWRVILLSPNDEVANAATCTLAREVYTDSCSILSYPHHRARQVHLLLLARCVQQLEKSAQRMRNSSCVSASEKEGEIEMELSSDGHERTFLRTLRVLTTFMESYKNKPHFSTPDIWPLIPSRPSSPNGDSVGLKIQTFDQGKSSAIQSIDIGSLNTLGCLLTRVREVSGFDNYRMYYRGGRFSPSETNIRMTLDDMGFCNGLILVKREDCKNSSPSSSCPGASILEIELLSQFNQFWGYLDFPDHIAHKIYQLLKKFPADSSIVSKLLSDDTTCLDAFPPQQPFKSLYALFAINEMTDINRIGRLHFLEGSMVDLTKTYYNSLTRALKLVVGAIDDPKILDVSQPRMIQLGLDLMATATRLFRDLTSKTKETTDAVDFNPPAAGRLIDILSTASLRSDTANMQALVFVTAKAILELSSQGDALWLPLIEDTRLPEVLVSLLASKFEEIRNGIISIISDATEGISSQSSHSVRIGLYMWPIVAGIIPVVARKSNQCNEIFRLAEDLLLRLSDLPQNHIDIGAFCKMCVELLLNHVITEEIGADHVDLMAFNLVKLVLCSLKIQPSILQDQIDDQFAFNLFWKLLFPREPFDSDNAVHNIIITSAIREHIYSILEMVAACNERQRFSILRSLSEVAPLISNTEYPLYRYDLQPQFDRTKVIRASCGYAGLRNLSNTCYLNSLFTQLFMNIDFRELVLRATVCDEDEQRLLVNTQRLFGNMQNTMARFVDPSSVVASIKTYDEGPIDISNQMDVDEFYNLLFDRFESQMMTSNERKRVRSFFGGQIVQQVKSLECEHVSERLEPFSAIQCDIKGKATLMDSLQAYVDGELLDGDNKYKCSNCDKHVNAVKRACFQDMPDNLIFHLKRFDFNLRTLQRSKINDHFSFPRTIDMNPYTVTHLSSPEKSSEPDVFELVGILVHTGTAESGHYYSYIKDRPCLPDTDKWLEFNDDTVSQWDPMQMESSTFGGFEPHMSYDNTPEPIEKAYSAYMLFYQRTSTLKKLEESMITTAQPLPFKVGLPVEINTGIRDENFLILRRHCLYDPAHVQFVLRIFEQSRAHHSNGAESSHGEQRLAMGVTLSHFDQVVSRVKGLPDFSAYEVSVSNAIATCSDCALEFFRHFYKHKESFRVILQRCPEPCVRQGIGLMMLNALQVLKRDQPLMYHPTEVDCDHVACILHGTMDILEHLWQTFHTCIRAWDEYFQFILSFAKMGELETAHLLGDDYLVNFAQIVTVDQSLRLTPQLSRLLNMMNRRAANLKPVSLHRVFMVIEHFLGSISPTFSQDLIVDNPFDRVQWLAEKGTPLPWSSNEVNVFHQTFPLNSSNVFMAKICSHGQSTPLVERIVKRLTISSPLMENHLLTTLREGISGGFTHHRITPFVRCAISYCCETQDVDRVVDVINFISRQTVRIQTLEGKIFPLFFKVVHQNALQRLTTDWDTGLAILKTVLQTIKIWAPWLLCYNLNSSPAETRAFTDEFLAISLFQYGCPVKVPDEEGGEEIAGLISDTIHQTGLACLQHLNENVIDSKTQVARDSMQSIQHTIAKCTEYFDDPNEDSQDGLFRAMSQNILGGLQPFLVDQLEEEASDWDNSDISSGQYATIDMTVRDAVVVEST
ncbi:hypothetical protein BROUX41_004154 [Berkeleyomyces rouxiae]|uniref:uncharacterized protein n=1 Tax=Berkeleyomyces rouxiae TaxID=2035830 RepID=UPI003B78FEA8